MKFTLDPVVDLSTEWLPQPTENTPLEVDAAPALTFTIIQHSISLCVLM